MLRTTTSSSWAAAVRSVRYVAAGLMVSASVAAAGLIVAASAAHSTGGTIGLVVETPSQLETSAYLELYAVAGRPEREQLVLTKSEVWTIAERDWDTLSKAAARIGVTIRKLDANWNRALEPMANGKPMTDDQKTMMDHAMRSKAAVGMSMMALPDAAIEEYALTKGMHNSRSATEKPTLLIPLTADLAIFARRTSISRTAGGYAWHGTVEETGEPVMLLWRPEGKMTGTATYQGHVYAIHNLGGGMHGVVKMDLDALPPDHAPMSATALPNAHIEKDPLVSQGDASAMKAGQKGPSTAPPTSKPRRSDTRNLEDAAPGKLALAFPNATELAIAPSRETKPDAPVTIRILVAYTAAVAKAYSEIETDLVALAIEQANQSFRDSGIGNVQLELAHAYQTDYVESGTHFDHVFRFADKGDGYIEDVQFLRDEYKADVGLLIVDDANGCGLAAEVFARPERAFAVVHHACAATMYSLAHEIGHLIGARHDEALDDSVMPFAFGHGYVHGNEWRTMMGYKDSCGGCIRLPIWSNPAVTVRGQPAGDATSDNARVIAENAARIAGFR